MPRSDDKISILGDCQIWSSLKSVKLSSYKKHSLMMKLQCRYISNWNPMFL